MSKQHLKTATDNRYAMAFTLIELMVVIAIIAILAALLLPALSNAKDKGKSIKCISNIRQLSMAAHFHVDDNEEALPWSERFWTAPANRGFNFTDPSSPSFLPNFYAQMRTYLGSNDGFWHCPAAQEDKTQTVAGDPSPLLGYMGNMFAVGVTVAPRPEARPKKQSQLLAPSQAKLFTDTGANWQGAWIGMTFQSNLFSSLVTPVPLHQGGINVALADGAARYVNRNEFQRPGGPSVPLQIDERQNWWREGAVELVP